MHAYAYAQRWRSLLWRNSALEDGFGADELTEEENAEARIRSGRSVCGARAQTVGSQVFSRGSVVLSLKRNRVQRLSWSVRYLVQYLGSAISE